LFILIVGCGRVGSSVARAMLSDGHEVSCLDEDPESHARLEVGLDKGWEDLGGQFTVGAGLETDALVAAGIEKADAFIASTDGDNTNIVIAQIARRKFDVERVIVFDPDAAQVASVIGGLTAVHQFCRIGRFAITGGCSKIVQDVPPFMIADGNPAKVRGINQVGLERAGYTPEKMKPIKEAFRLLYRAKLNTGQALQETRAELSESAEVREILAFVEESERGIVR